MTKKQIFRLNRIIGELYIGQWKGKRKQSEYRKAINTIFHTFFNLQYKDWERYY